MDLNTVTGYRFARTRADLILAPGETFLAGGTWEFSDPKPHVTGLVDLTTMPWAPWERTAAGLTLSATCTIADLVKIPAEPGWHGHPLLAECAHGLLASWKVWNLATIGGNVARSFAAGAMIAMLATLDASALIWLPDGAERRIDVADIPTGNGTNRLQEGEVIRAFEIPEHALQARTVFEKIALATLGRSGVVVTGRLDAGGAVTIVITAATYRPERLRYPSRPDVEQLRSDVLALDTYYTDPLGTADWRRGVSAELAERALARLGTERP